MKKLRNIIVFVMIFCLGFSSLSKADIADAAAKKYVKSLTVSKKSISLKVGQSKKIAFKVKATKAASKKITAKSGTNIVEITTKGRYLVVKGKKEGTGKVIVTTRAKNKAGKKLKKTITVSVKNNPDIEANSSDDFWDSEEASDDEEDQQEEDMESEEEQESNEPNLKLPGKTAESTAVPIVTVRQTAPPTAAPKEAVKPTVNPTAAPKATVKPTAIPTAVAKVTVKPTAVPTAAPKVTAKPTVAPTAKPTNIPIANGTYRINTKVKSNMLLDVFGNSSADKTNIQIYENNNSNAQQFNVTHMGNGWYKICSFSSGKALDVTAAEKKSGVNVQLYTYNGSDAQLWRFLAADGGYYYIQNKLGYYLDVDGGKTANNTNVWVYAKNNTNSQKWKMIQVIYPAAVSMSTSSVTLTGIGATKKLTTSFTPSNTTEKGVTWTSSNTKVATVSNGTIKAVGSGTATITVKTTNGKTASAGVKVADGAVQIESGLYNINTKVSANLMLDVAEGKTCDGANIQIYEKNGSAAQKFKIESAGNGWYTISNTYPKKCLDVQGGSNKAGTNVLLYQSNNSDAQLWRFYSAGNGYYTMMNKLGCYLDVDGGIAKNGRNVLVYTKNDTNAQKWKLIKTTADNVNISDSLFTFSSKVGSNLVLDVDGGKTADGTNVQIYKGNDSNAQKFNVQPTGDGWFKISNPLSGKCLDVNGGSNKSGTNVQLYSYNGTDAQKWRFYSSGDGDYFWIKNKLGCYLDVDGAKTQNGTNVLVYKKNNTNAQKWKLSETSAILLNSGSFTLDGVGKTKTLSVFYEPARIFAANKSITWTSSNTKVATVSNGVVKAIGSGTATITAKAFNGKTAAVTVTVNTIAQMVMNEALKYQGWKYVFGGSSPSTSFDCSGLVQWCYGKAGVKLPRTAQQQYNATNPITLAQAVPGDLVFFHTTYATSDTVTHVGIYVGNNKMYHAGSSGIGYVDLTSSYYQKHLIGAGRIR